MPLKQEATAKAARSQELHLCSHVTDGDTIKVIFRGQTEKLRILDIDAPKSAVQDA